MPKIPLLCHTRDAIVAYRGAQSITAQQFLADVTRLASLLPEGKHVLNACADRYQFSVGLAACLIENRISLLPPTYLPEMVRYLKEFTSDAFCLTDSADCDIDLPLLKLPSTPAKHSDIWSVPSLACDQKVAYVFTSGSTGIPVPHAKTWGPLVANVRAEATRLRLTLTDPQHVLLATVPAQHMYGFESSVLVALQSGQAFCSERPFYPADIADALALVPRPRVLITTPIHLRALLAYPIRLPAVDLVLCATAPLESAIAAAAEIRFSAPLLEIYGTTETGQIASRRTSVSLNWWLFPDIKLTQTEGITFAHGGHVEAPVPLGDLIELLSDNEFLLHGRVQDLINIAGKRSSLAYLNHQLMAVPGVIDGVFYIPEDRGEHSPTGTTRLAALVVAPGITADTILRSLRNHIDPVFLPRPLQTVDQIPRNSTGKIAASTLNQLAPLNQQRSNL